MLGGPEASKVQASGWQHFPGKSAGNWVYYTFQIVNYVVKFQVAVFSFFVFWFISLTVNDELSQWKVKCLNI